MNLVALNTFLTVVRVGNLNKAAAILHVTQSTVTARLDTLEDALGQKLLLRSRQGAQLTKAGFAFQRYAELMVQTWDISRRRIGLPKGFSGLFSFACHQDFWDRLGARIIEDLLNDHPDLAVETWPGEAGEIQRWLSSGLVDAALTSEPVAGYSTVCVRVADEQLVQVASVDRSVVAWDPTYIYVDLGPEFRRAHALAWPNDETARISYASSRWALEHLLSRGGSAYLPWRVSAPLVQARHLFPVRGAPAFQRPIYVAWREASAALHPWVRDLQATVKGMETWLGS